MQQVIGQAERYLRARVLQFSVAASGIILAAFILAALLSPCFGGTWQAFSLISAAMVGVITVLRFGRSKLVIALTLISIMSIGGIARPYLASAASGSCPVGDDEVFAGEIGIQGGTAFTTTVTAAPAADGTWTIPAAGQATDTFAGIAAAQTLTNKTLTAPTMSGIATGSWVARWSGGTAITAAQYEISRDADATNQLHFNVPTGAGYEWSVNDAAELTLTATTLDAQNNAITTTGAITGSTFNGNTISTGTGTLTLGAGKTATISNTLTFTGTDASSVAFGTGGTVTYTANNLSVFAATTSAQLAGVISDEQGSGALVFATSPSLTTPTLGVASATSINKVAFTTPATGSTLTIADGKTLTASNTLTFTGTDGSSVAFGTGGTAAYTGGTLAQFAATTSAQLAGVISDETGSGALVFGTAPTIDSCVFNSGASFDISCAASQSGGDYRMQIANSSNTANSTAIYYANVAGSSAGDPFYIASVTGGGTWAWGLDNSDSDLFKLSSTSDVGTGTVFTINSSGEFGFNRAPTTNVIGQFAYGSVGNIGFVNSAGNAAVYIKNNGGSGANSLSLENDCLNNVGNASTDICTGSATFGVYGRIISSTGQLITQPSSAGYGTTKGTFVETDMADATAVQIATIDNAGNSAQYAGQIIVHGSTGQTCDSNSAVGYWNIVGVFQSSGGADYIAATEMHGPYIQNNGCDNDISDLTITVGTSGDDALIYCNVDYSNSNANNARCVVSIELVWSHYDSATGPVLGP